MQREVEIYKQAAFCRAFEREVYDRVARGEIKIPVYLSAGQEYIPVTLAHELKSRNPAVFIQHRNHSQYIAFGGSVEHLVRELTSGMQGSASIADGRIFGHDGMMGSQVPIAVGYCHATNEPTICFLGDAAAEEDYVLAAFGWAATKRLSILFVVEDNNLAILTEKKVRRSWSVSDVARGFGIDSYDITDHPTALTEAVKDAFKWPILLNVETTRLYWHAGAGKDGDYFDRHSQIAKTINVKGVDEREAEKVKEIWKHYETRYAA